VVIALGRFTCRSSTDVVSATTDGRRRYVWRGRSGFAGGKRSRAHDMRFPPRIEGTFNTWFRKEDHDPESAAESRARFIFL